MPNSVTDQFFFLDADSPPPGGSAVSVVNLVATDQNDDGDIDSNDPDTIGGVGISDVWRDDSVTINVSGVGNVTYTGTTIYLTDGNVVFTPTDGQVLQAGTFVTASIASSYHAPMAMGQFGPPCFLPGTCIETPHGPLRIEDLSPGDLVNCRDKGPVPLRAKIVRQVGRRHLQHNPRHRPIRIEPGALGTDMPARPLAVSPQHRMLICSPIVERMFGVREVLVPAAYLTELRGVLRLGADVDVTYIHLLFDHHSILTAEGLKTESLFLGVQVLDGLSRQEWQRLRGRYKMARARLFVTGPKARTLVMRHIKNAVPMVCSAEPTVRHKVLDAI